MNRLVLVAGGLAAIVVVGGFWWMSQDKGGGMKGDGATTGTDATGPNIPALSAEAEQGKLLFDENCAACHGENAAGSDKGPPFINRIYEPGHHGDAAFAMAAKQGVRAHHWRFGDMPAVAGVTNADVARIVVYVREIQRANGIQ